MRSVWGVARHELLLWLRSPAAIAAALLPALGMGVLVALMTVSMGWQPLALVVEGQGAMAVRMGHLIDADEEAYLILAMDRAEADRALRQQRVAAVVLIPADFDARIEASDAQIELYLNNIVDVDLADDIRRALTRSLAELDAPQLGVLGERQGPSHGLVLDNPFRVAIAEKDLRETDVTFFHYQMIPIVVLIVICVGMLGTSMLTARDFEGRTAKLLTLSPTPRGWLIAGKLVGGVLMTLTVVAPLVGLAAALGWMAPPPGHWPALVGARRCAGGDGGRRRVAARDLAAQRAPGGDGRAQPGGLSLLPRRWLHDGAVPAGVDPDGEQADPDELRHRRAAAGAVLSRPRRVRTRSGGRRRLRVGGGDRRRHRARPRLEARVRRGALLLVVVAAAACTEDLSDKPIIGAAPPSSVSSSGVSPSPKPALPAGPPWRSELCRPRGDASAGSLRFNGECTFAVPEPALCRPDEDDFYILVKRTLAGGQSFNFYVNVERHHGAGEYDGNAQIHITVRDGAALYRWSNFTGTITLAGDTLKAGPDARFSLRGVRLDPEPGTLARGSIVVDGSAACQASTEPPTQ